MSNIRKLFAFRLAQLVCLSCLLFPGCGKSSDKLEVSGEVSLDGEPLDTGSITLTSLEGKKTSTGAMIRDGKFEVPQEKGLLPGSYHVDISSADSKGPPVIVQGSPGGPGISVARERIPAEYNTNSKQSINVAKGGDNHFVFKIVSRPTK
jgi:hypothetical protein